MPSLGKRVRQNSENALGPAAKKLKTGRTCQLNSCDQCKKSKVRCDREDGAAKCKQCEKKGCAQCIVDSVDRRTNDSTDKDIESVKDAFVRTGKAMATLMLHLVRGEENMVTQIETRVDPEKLVSRRVDQLGYSEKPTFKQVFGFSAGKKLSEKRACLKDGQEYAWRHAVDMYDMMMCLRQVGPGLSDSCVDELSGWFKLTSTDPTLLADLPHCLFEELPDNLKERFQTQADLSALRPFYDTIMKGHPEYVAGRDTPPRLRSPADANPSPPQPQRQGPLPEAPAPASAHLPVPAFELPNFDHFDPFLQGAEMSLVQGFNIYEPQQTIAPSDLLKGPRYREPALSVFNNVGMPDIGSYEPGPAAPEVDNLVPAVSSMGSSS